MGGATSNIFEKNTLMRGFYSLQQQAPAATARIALPDTVGYVVVRVGSLISQPYVYFMLGSQLQTPAHNMLLRHHSPPSTYHFIKKQESSTRLDVLPAIATTNSVSSTSAGQ